MILETYCLHFDYLLVIISIIVLVIKVIESYNHCRDYQLPTNFQLFALFCLLL